MKRKSDDKATIPFRRSDRSERLAAVLDRYLVVLEGGGIPPDLDEIVAEHPDLGDDLRSYVDSLQLLHRMTSGLRPGTASSYDATAHDTSATKRLGDYEIIREIGRGGMGIVYEACQVSLQRQVALKVLPFAAMLDERQIARFRNEAQAAAQLHHPNIVPVHAVGQERGVHFFAMQFITGQSLEAALHELRGTASPSENPEDAEAVRPIARSHSTGEKAPATAPQAGVDTLHHANFSTRASMRSRGHCRSVARLIIQAADAIQHAHELGVIHRDVKPSNLLLDRDGTLWVTDFGLARIQTDGGVTISGDVVGTLRYMSPEQAAGASALVDARTDVYSLGATLYELLTLQPAHRGANRQQLLAYIETQEPVPPRAINSAIPVDLETVVMRALAKNRDDRYATAQGLADDLRAFLDGKPTVAQRPSLLDRAAKWALRHRRAVMLAAAFLVIITMVSATAAVMIARANRGTATALAEARHHLSRAEEHYQQARDVVDNFGVGLAGELAALPGTEPIRRQLLTDTLRYYRQFIAQASGDAALVRELAGANFKAAVIAESLGDRDEAIDLCRQAVTQFDALHRQATTDAEIGLERAKSHNNLGLLLASAGNAEDATLAYDDAIDQLRLLLRERQNDVDVARSLAETYSNLGLFQGELGRQDEARRSILAAIRLLDALGKRHPDNVRVRHDLAIGYNNLSFLERQSNWEAAEKASRKAVELLAGLSDDDDAPLAVRADLAICFSNLGSILGRRQAWNEACESYRQAILLQEQLARQASAVVQYRRDLAVSWNNLGQALDASGDASAAKSAYDAAQEIISLLVTDYPNELAIRSLCGAILNNQAMLLENSDRLDEALAAYRRAVEHQQVAYQRAPLNTEYREYLSKHYFNYGRTLRAAGKPLLAVGVANQRRELWAGHGEHLGQVAAEQALAAAQVLSGDSTEAGVQQSQAIQEDIATTLRQAAAAGCNLQELRRLDAFALLQSDDFWANLDTVQRAGPLPGKEKR